MRLQGLHAMEGGTAYTEAHLSMKMAGKNETISKKQSQTTSPWRGTASRLSGQAAILCHSDSYQNAEECVENEHANSESLLTLYKAFAKQHESYHCILPLELISHLGELGLHVSLRLPRVSLVETLRNCLHWIGLWVHLVGDCLEC